MRENPVKTKLARGERAYGTMVFEFFSPGMAQICKSAGAEFILYDMEHSAVSLETVKEQFAYCRGVGLVPMARVPTTQYHFIARVLDAGAMGVMVPMVESREQAELIASCAHYPPTGIRGAAFGFSHDDFIAGPVAEKIEALHARTFTICLIETAKGVDNVDAIAQVAGIDALWLGHFDLTNFMGIPGQFDNPRYLEAVDRIIEAGRKHSKPVGFMAADEVWARDYIAKGFRLLAWSNDAHILQGALRSGLASMQKMAAGQ